MLISILKKILSLKPILLFLLKLDNFIYKLITISSIENNGGVHPKHKIINYEDWFIKNINEDDHILDIGSNLGKMAINMSKKCKRVSGIEINQASVKIAKEKANEKTNFFASDATLFNFESIESVDCITMSNVLEHIENRESFLRLLIKNVNWVEGPKFLIRVPLIDREWISPFKKNLNIEWRLDRTHFIEYTEASFKEELYKCGLQVIFMEIRFGELYAKCSLKN